MSKFGVYVEKLDKITPHDNADRLELATLLGRDYTLVVGKGEFQEGDLVIYFPVDSLIPMPIVETLGLVGKLAHGELTKDVSLRLRNRVKTIKLRGEISQGVICPATALSKLFTILPWRCFHDHDNLMEFFGVTKYEPPEISTRRGNLIQLPKLVSHYDIEGAQNHIEIVDEYLMDEPVYITEKIEGSHWWASTRLDRSISIGQRNYEIVDVIDDNHNWHKVLKNQGLEGDLRRLWYEIFYANYSTELVTIRGEITGPGIQKNYYQSKKYSVYIFEIEVNGISIPAKKFVELTKELDIQTVPMLSIGKTLREWLDGRTIKEASDGQSVICQRKREGIVIKPMEEKFDRRIGRVFIKQHSLAYLAKSKL